MKAPRAKTRGMLRHRIARPWTPEPPRAPLARSDRALKHNPLTGRSTDMTGSVTGQEAALKPLVRPWYRSARASGEAALVREAKRGSEGAVEALVRSHWDGAHRAAFLIVHDAAAAEDIAQEAVLAAVRNIDHFDRRRPFRPWLHRIVVNRSLDWLRKRRHEVHMNELPGIPAADPGLPGAAMAALADMEPELRALIVMRHLHGYRSS